MKETDYAYSVARIRANETSLFTSSDIEQLIASGSYSAAMRLLVEKGWIDSESNPDINAVFKRRIEMAWQLLTEIAPVISVLDFLIVKNDFHNIKAALKAFVSSQISAAGIKSSDNFIVPSLIDPELIRASVFGKKLDVLPAFARNAIEKTYPVLIRTADGQLADIMLDSMALNESKIMAGNTKDNFIIQMAELMCAASNIKIAYRAAKTGRDRQFLETALSHTETLNSTILADAAVKGFDKLIDLILSSPYHEAADLMRISASSLEKWCDDLLMAHVETAKYKSFGTAPLIAYYIARDAETRNVRIVLSCLHNNIPPESIRERMRRMYV